MADQVIRWDEEKLKIFGGPPKDEFITGVSYGDSRQRIKLLFQVDPTGDCRQTKEIEVVVDGAVRNDGSGQSWDIVGMAYHVKPGKRFSGNYSTHSRTGILVFQ